MIVFNLTCPNNHNFEGWFSSAEDYNKQNDKNQISCPQCASKCIEKRISAPYVNTKNLQTQKKKKTSVNPNLSTKDLNTIRNEIIDHVLKSTEDVGDRFPEEARRIHYEEAPARFIRGHASETDVQDLQEEGIDVVPVPGIPKKTH